MNPLGPGGPAGAAMPAPPRNGVAAAAGGGAAPSDAPAPRVGTLCCLCGGLAPFSSSSFKGMAGPSSRRCRDVLCLIVFVLFWAGAFCGGDWREGGLAKECACVCV